MRCLLRPASSLAEAVHFLLLGGHECVVLAVQEIATCFFVMRAHTAQQQRDGNRQLPKHPGRAELRFEFTLAIVRIAGQTVQNVTRLFEALG